MCENHRQNKRREAVIMAVNSQASWSERFHAHLWQQDTVPSLVRSRTETSLPQQIAIRNSKIANGSRFGSSSEFDSGARSFYPNLFVKINRVLALSRLSFQCAP